MTRDSPAGELIAENEQDANWNGPSTAVPADGCQAQEDDTSSSNQEDMNFKKVLSGGSDAEGQSKPEALYQTARCITQGIEEETCNSGADGGVTEPTLEPAPLQVDEPVDTAEEASPVDMEGLAILSR